MTYTIVCRSFLLAPLLFFCLGTSGQFWQVLQDFGSSDALAGDGFGNAMDVSGDVALASAPGKVGSGSFFSPAGAVYFFERDGSGTWSEVQTVTHPAGTLGTSFGTSVSVEGNLALIGSTSDAAGPLFQYSGSAHLYSRDSGTGLWSFVQTIFAPFPAQSDGFGNAVNISIGRLFIGCASCDYDASGDNSLTNSGAAFVYEDDGAGQWLLSTTLTAPIRSASQAFGRACAANEDQLAVSATGDMTDASGDNPLSFAGAVYLFERQPDGSWIFVQKVAPFDRAEFDQTGYEVDLHDGRVIFNSGNSNDASGNPGGAYGSVYVYKRDVSGAWNLEQKLKDTFTDEGEFFGNTVSIEGERLLIGSYSDGLDENEMNPLSNAGAFLGFEFNAGSSEWQFLAKGVSDNREPQASFGGYAVVNEGFAFITAPGETNDAIDPVAPGAGMMYVLEFDPTTCTIDSDEDGIDDCTELAILYTDPNDPDSDNDGLSDGLEVNSAGTDPNLVDTDGDGCDDATEFAKECPGFCPEDLNGDGSVGTADILILIGTFGTACP